ncbi:hypothetical protein H9L19_05530 [Weissella diestrammenae]|uniref:LPXTG cell wall anchor domain-containing protein n=1 Tax=Weissella diestrammenae TaxID=1162633 RepID=A0A7G9T435_9LACO|nr:hypothetical protein [Weissella diestrammenae]MCM0583382.1 hypothetical protein [Weissella diestrammenae]QNN74860.1 hypothetical protein H9L19_05530 [Weissella diestrammenae]
MTNKTLIKSIMLVFGTFLASALFFSMQSVGWADINEQNTSSVTFDIDLDKTHPDLPNTGNVGQPAIPKNGQEIQYVATAKNGDLPMTAATQVSLLSWLIVMLLFMLIHFGRSKTDSRQRRER